LLPVAVHAEEQVPARVQAELLVKVAAYDQHLVARTGEHRVLLIMDREQVDSEGMAKRMKSELSRFERIAGKPHREELIVYDSPAALAQICRQRDASIVFLSTGLGSAIPAIAAAMNGVQVLTVAADPDYVKPGAVLGFDLVSGKPKLLVNLGQARRQNVKLRAELLRLAKVYR
jgi:hypothetical protein